MAKTLQAIYPFLLLIGKMLPSKSEHYIRSAFFILLFSISTSLSSQTTIQSVNDGSWNSANIWQGTSLPTAADNVIINNNDTIKPGTTTEVNNLSISSSGILVVEGTLIVNGNLNMADNGSQLVTDPGANVFIFKDANLANKVFINLSNYFIVLGNFSKSGSHNQGELTINNAHVYIFGTVDIPYQKDDPWQNFSLCSTGEYNGTTLTENDVCDAGDSIDFANIVQPEDLPDEIYDRITGCEEPSIIGNLSISNFNYCLNETATALVISATGDGLNYQWYRDHDTTPQEGDETPVGTNSNSFTPSTSSPGTSYYYCIVTGDCGTVMSNVSGAITVYNTTIVSGELGGDPEYTYCSGRNPYPINPGEPSGGDRNYIYQWQQSDDCSVTWVDAVAQDGISNALSFNPPALTDTMCYRLKITDGCGNVGYSVTKTYNVVPDAISQTINPTPASGTSICVDEPVSATFSGGTGGTGTVTDVYEYSTDGGSSWNSYTSGSTITATTGMLGTDMIQIRTRREASETGCDDSDWNTVSWSVFETPTAVISGNTTICDDGSSSTLTIDFTGNGPWDITIQRDGANDSIIQNINTNPYFHEVSEEGTYTISSVNNQNCNGTATGSATVTVNPLPTVTISSTNSQICSGEDAEFYLSGTEEATVTYSLDGGSTTNTIVLTGGSAVVTVPSSASDQTITLISVTDTNCSQSLNENATVTVNNIPNNTTNGFSGTTICQGENGILTFDAINTIFEAPISIQYTDGTNTWSQEITTADETQFNVAVNPTSTTNYTLISITNGNDCMRTFDFGDSTARIIVNEFNMLVTDETPTPSGNHCPEFGGPFNPDNSDYNAGVTEVIFKVTKEESITGNWTFDFEIDQTGEVEVYDLVSVTGNNSTITYNNDVAGGSIDATDNTEVTYTFWIVNVPGTALDVKITVSNGNDGVCSETSSTNDNNITHVINEMPAVGSFTP